MKSSIILVLVISAALLKVGESKWTHAFSAESSSELAEAIKNKILQNINNFSDEQFAKQLEQDLKTGDDSKRQLKQISEGSVTQLFQLFNIPELLSHCQFQNDKLSGDGLLCLNQIWKNYVPPN